MTTYVVANHCSGLFVTTLHGKVSLTSWTRRPVDAAKFRSVARAYAIARKVGGFVLTTREARALVG